MDTNSGLFIAIEGIDGSGKATQFDKLVERLTAEGHEVVTFDFPRYDEPSSYFVRQYLAGNYGSADEVGPYTGSLFFALDRYEAAPKIRQALSEGKVVVANRFAGSNMAQQGTKFRSAEERRGYFIWLDNLEFQMLRIPRPNYNFVLRVAAETAQQLIEQETNPTNVAEKQDSRDADLAGLGKSVEVYDDLCNLFPKDFTRIDCARGDRLLGVDEVHKLLWEKITPSLPAPKYPHGSVVAVAANPTELAKPYLEKTGSQTVATVAGRKYLAEAVTNPDGNVYAFSDKVAPLSIATVMAKLGRGALGNIRSSILNEFSKATDMDSKLGQPNTSGSVDDTTKQLVCLHLVVENASNLLTRVLRWGRPSAFIEQPLKYIGLGQRDENGKYRYFVPPELDANTKNLYGDTMDEIFDRYSTMVHDLTDYFSTQSETPKDERNNAWKEALRARANDTACAVLPLATKFNVGIFTSAHELEDLVAQLLSNPLPEAQSVGMQLQAEGRKALPALLGSSEKPEHDGTTIAYRADISDGIRKLVEEYLPVNHSSETDLVTLSDIWPRNELDLVPDMLYEHSDKSLQTIREEVDTWSYDKKLSVFEAYIGERLIRQHVPGRALEKVSYGWDLVCDFGVFRDLQHQIAGEYLEWQQSSPRFGYDVPDIIEEAGITDQYEACFDLSLKLHSIMQQAGFGLEAQYATLLGHKLRWKITMNGLEAFHFNEVCTAPGSNPASRKLVLQMHEKLTQKHPILAEAMKFVNQGEDEQLTRLAAERYTQFKLDQLQ